MQNQIVIGHDTIHSNGVYSAIDVTFGEAIENQLATKMSLRAKVITKLATNHSPCLQVTLTRMEGCCLALNAAMKRTVLAHHTLCA